MAFAFCAWQPFSMARRAFLMSVLCICDALGTELVAACQSGVGGDESSWCSGGSTAGQPVRRSPDSCTTEKSAPPPHSSTTSSNSCVQCTPRCGATKVSFAGGNVYYTDTDLPSGACSTDGELCDMAGTAPLRTCHGQTFGCAVNVYRCTCSGGKWGCVMTSQGGGTCGACIEDGGAE